MVSDTYTLTISDIGIPATHAASHASGGSDALSISASQVTAGTLPVARGGTGLATVTGYVKGTGTSALSTSSTIPVADISGTLPVANGGTGVGTSTGTGNNVLSTSPTLVTPILGTPTSGTLTACTGLPLTAGVTGILPIANGGTGYGFDGVSVFKFDTTPATTATNVGELNWNITDKTLDLKLENGVTLQVGQESNIYAHNATGATIPNGSVVYIYGADGTIPAVKIASNNDSSAKKTLGIATQEILSGADGYITTQGLVRDLNTSAYSSGTPLYLSTAGALTSTEPVYPATVVRIGVTVQQNVTTGSIYIQPQLFSDGRAHGSFPWGTGGATSVSTTVTGLSSTSSVIIQERGPTPVGSMYSVVCTTNSFTAYARIDAASTGAGSLPASSTVFSYIAFI
jgi:hypothetical protein